MDASEIQAVYLSSEDLDSDAVVAFVKALAAISQVIRVQRNLLVARLG